MKKTITVIISLILVITILTIFAVASFAANNEKNLSERKTLMKGSFTLYSLDGSSKEEEFFYSDSYFDGSSKEEHVHLRTLSAAVSFSLNDMTQSDGSDSVLSKIGFFDIVTYDMDHAAADTIGTVIAQKKIGDTVVVALMLRGYDYDSEWSSNFLAGTEGDAEGFSSSARLAAQRLYAYLSERQITSAKIWVTGYSRSAAVANLVGKALNENPGYYAADEDDIYVYTFESPNCSADATAYENIHNTIDSRDLITYVYPEAWGLSRCGVTEPIGDPDTTIMSKRFALLGENLMTDFQEVNLAEFLNEYMAFLSEHISRETYVEELQQYLCSFSEMYYTLSESEKEGLAEFFNRFLENFKNDENTPTVLMNLVLSSSGDAQFEAFVNLLKSNLEKAYEQDPSFMSEEQFELIKNAVHPIIFLLQSAMKADASTRKLDANGKSTKVTLYYLMTLLGNLDDIISCHVFDSVFELLKQTDSYYTDNCLMKIGDSDGDGSVTVLDATAIQKDLAKLYTIDEERIEPSDVDYDSSITILDATAIQKYLASLGNPYQIDEYLPV